MICSNTFVRELSAQFVGEEKADQKQLGKAALVSGAVFYAFRRLRKMPN